MSLGGPFNQEGGIASWFGKVTGHPSRDTTPGQAIMSFDMYNDTTSIKVVEAKRPYL